MKKLKTYAIVSFMLGIMSVAAIIFSHLALTDIWHGEPNPGTEWKVVQIGFAFIILFHISVFLTLYNLFSFLKKEFRL
jgi:hypothetical protein